MSETESNNNNAWLGLLKWSLNYVDGTVPSNESEGFKEMSKEDRAFLEEVMKNGIVDEGERMKTILSSLVAYLDNILKGSSGGESKDETIDATSTSKDDVVLVVSEDEALVLLEDLQFIVEQIDYAKSFAAMGGIEFLIGFSAQKENVSKTIRSACLTALSTLCQNNPPAQYMMLEHGAILKLLQLYSAEFPKQKCAKKDDGDTADGLVDTDSLRAKIVQVMSSSIRNHETAEQIFCMNVEGVQMIESGLGIHCAKETLGRPDVNLKRKSLFFLQALVTSDAADVQRICKFTQAIQYTVCNFLDPTVEDSQEIREMTLSMLSRILARKCCVDPVLDMKPTLIFLGVKRVTALRALEGEEREYAEEELKLWESLITNIARTPRDEE